MKVRFREDVLNDWSAYRKLNRIVDYFETGQHVWDLDDEQKIRESDWMCHEPGSSTTMGNLEILEKAAARRAYASASSLMHTLVIWVTSSPKPMSQEELAPPDADLCLGRPVYVVVENASSDRLFLMAMIHAYERKNLLDADTDAWWRVDQAGGFGEIGKALDRIFEQPIDRRRVIVLSDSDRKVPEESTPTVKKVTQCCRAQNVQCCILKKRTIENYLPNSALEQLPGRRGQRRAFSRLTDTQRAHYPMKSGFEKDKAGHAIVPQEQKDLFAGVPRTCLDGLCGGCGEHVSELFQMARTQITRHSMRRPCGDPPNEITDLLDRIERLL